MFIGFRPHVGPQGRSKTPKDETLSKGKSETPKDVWLSQLRQEIRTAVKDQTSLSHSNPIAEAVKAKENLSMRKEKKLDGIQKKLDEIKEKSIALKPQKTPQPSEIEKDWSSCVELRREIQVTIKELIDNNPEIFRPNNDVSIDIPFAFLDQNHLGEAEVYYNSLTAILQQLKEKISAQREDLENKFDKHYRTLSKTAKETVKSDAYKNDFLERKLTQVIAAHPRVPEKFIRQEFSRASIEQRNEAIVNKMAQKYDELLQPQESETTSSGSLDSASSVITFSTSSPSVSTISSASSLSSPDHQTTTSQPIQESPKQPEPKRSWLRSCLDSVVSLFQRKPKKTDVKEVFPSEAGRGFLLQVTETISNNSVPLRSVFADASIDDKRYDKKLFIDFSQRLPRLIEEKEKSDRNFRFLGLENQTTEKRAEAVIENTALLFKEFYENRLLYRNQFQTELKNLESKLKKTDVIKARILNLRQLVQIYEKMEVEHYHIWNEIKTSPNLKTAAEMFFPKNKS